MKNIFKGKRILITGGAGSVGCALTERLLKYDPAAIRIFDISENALFEMKSRLFGRKNVRYLVGDIRNIERLRMAIEGIDIVIHLAAMKHVYACEYNPFEAIKTNIDGLQNVIDVSRSENVEMVVFSSTDKAANPLSVMGMTKLMGEKLISSANYYKGRKRTVFVSTRFGNVIGSNGSVVPLFKKQIEGGKPITITDKDMTRFVITMDEAIDLICSAIELGKGGETFVWKMRTLRVADLAEVMIDKYSKGEKIKRVIIGKGEGEKLHEEIIAKDELPRAVELKNLYILFPQMDYRNVYSLYKDKRPVRNPVIVSSMGRHMSRNEISKLLQRSVKI